MKYTLEEKLKMAKLHIDDGVPYQKIASKFIRLTIHIHTSVIYVIE